MTVRPHRPSASVDQLAREVRRLWGQEPLTDAASRETVLSQLTELDLTLERLTLRHTIAEPTEFDIDQLADCAQRLGDLRRHWPPNLVPHSPTEGPASCSALP